MEGRRERGGESKRESERERYLLKVRFVGGRAVERTINSCRGRRENKRKWSELKGYFSLAGINTSLYHSLSPFPPVPTFLPL